MKSLPRQPVNADRFLELITLSGLLSEDQLRAFQATFAPEDWKALCSNPRELAKAFVSSSQLTQWQANLLLDGKYKGFFLNYYVIQKLLGSGCMSSVYLAKHTMTHRLAAIKVLPKSKSENREVFGRFINDARCGGGIHHPHVMRYHEIDQCGATHYVVMEYEVGATIHELVKRDGPFDPFRAAHTIAQAADGLGALHGTGMIHRALTPGHLYLSEQGIVKILSLGLACSTREKIPPFPESPYDWETLAYRAPEMTLDLEQVGPPADIYSLGCILFFMLTGQAPFEIANAHEIMKHHKSVPLPPLNRVRPDVLAQLVFIFNRMTEKEPSRRYATANELLRDLEDFLSDEGGMPV